MSAESLSVLADKLSEPGALGGYFPAKRLYDAFYNYINRDGQKNELRNFFISWQQVLINKYYSPILGQWQDVSI